MSNHSVGVLCANCGLASRRPVSFVRVRRTFICGGCKEMIPLNGWTILDDGAADLDDGDAGVATEGAIPPNGQGRPAS